MWGWHASINEFSFRPTTAKQPEISCTLLYLSLYGLSGSIPKATLQHSSATTGPKEQSPDASAVQQQELTRITCPVSQPYCTTYHNVLWVQVITEGAIIKVDLVESLLCKADHFTLIEATILVLADDYLSRGQILECSLSSLRREKSLFIQ